MDKRRHKKSNLLVLLLLLLVGIGIGYAFLTSNLNIKGSSDIKKAGWDVHFENLVLGSNNVTATKEAAIDENDKTTVAYTIKLNKPGDKYDFTVDVVNSGTIDVKVDAVNKTGLTEEQAKYVEYTASYSDGNDVTIGNKLDVGSKETINVSVKYKTDLNPEDLPSEDKELSLKFEITYVQYDKETIVYPVSIYSLMKTEAYLDNVASRYVNSSTGIDFSMSSSDTNGKGVYMLSSTKNDTNPIYYYRGAVENNNVKFANFCWKIVRTTETGGIKLIYSGKPKSDGTCSITGSNKSIGCSVFNNVYPKHHETRDSAYVGYMYGTTGASTYAETHKNTNDSTIKKFIDEWYKNNMTSYTEKLEDTVWCNDRSLVSGTGVGTDMTYYGAHNRLRTNKSPSLECKNANDRFTVSASNGNGALTYPIALLTADELAYGGFAYNSYNKSFYFSAKLSTFTMTPDYSPQSSVYLLPGSTLKGHSLSTNEVNFADIDVAPSISLKSGTMIVDGDGSVNDPYVVE